MFTFPTVGYLPSANATAAGLALQWENAVGEARRAR